MVLTVTDSTLRVPQHRRARRRAGAHPARTAGVPVRLCADAHRSTAARNTDDASGSRRTAALTTLLSWPPLYRHLPRVLKDGIRAGAGLWGAVCLALAFAGAWITAGVGAAVLLGVFLAFSQVRNRQRKTMCEGCPELSEEGVCSGYARQAASMRVYEDAMSARVAPRVEAMLRDRSK